MSSIDATVFVPGPGQIKRCRGCSELIFFALSKEGRSMPVNSQSRPDGNLSVAPIQAGDQLPRAEVVRPAQAAGMRDAGIPTYLAHWATCPEADTFRKRARARGARQRGGRR